jgi:uncharacterized membrane protein YjjB (DUF3815 family)
MTADSVGSAGWSSPIDGSGLHDLMAFMVDLGDTMVVSGDAVTHVGECLGRVARVNGAHGTEIIVLPTALIITLPGLGEGRTEVAATGGSRLRLDQVEAVFTVAHAAERGDLGPRAALVALRSARNLPPSLQLVGIPAVTVAETQTSVIGAIAPWIGVLIFGVGVLLSYSGRPGSLGWMLLVLYVAYAGQVLGGLLFGSSLSAFVGAVVMTPVAVFVATQRTGPPTLVTFLPAFWLLVPGAIALVGVTQVMGEARVDGVSSILNAGVTIVSIALGVVLGLGLGDWVTRAFHRSVTTQRHPSGGQSH